MFRFPFFFFSCCSVHKLISAEHCFPSKNCVLRLSKENKARRLWNLFTIYQSHPTVGKTSHSQMHARAQKGERIKYLYFLCCSSSGGWSWGSVKGLYTSYQPVWCPDLTPVSRTFNQLAVFSKRRCLLVFFIGTERRGEKWSQPGGLEGLHPASVEAFRDGKTERLRSIRVPHLCAKAVLVADQWSVLHGIVTDLHLT